MGALFCYGMCTVGYRSHELFDVLNDAEIWPQIFKQITAAHSSIEYTAAVINWWVKQQKRKQMFIF